MQRRSGIKFALAVLVAMVAIVGGRVLWSARVEYRRARAALSSGDEQGAVVHFERALHWYFPGDPLQATTWHAVWEIAERAETAGDRALALQAYRAIRSSIMATRSFYVPHREWLEAANRKIAFLEATEPGAAWPDPSLPVSERRRIALDVLSGDPSPNPAWSLVSIGGLLGWLGAFVGLIWNGFDAGGRVRRKPVLAWGAGFAAAYAVWILGLAMA